MQIRKAERKKAKLRLALYGITQGGKTYSALRIAKGIGGKIAMIDTEDRGDLYGNEFDFDILVLEAPHSTERYVQAIKMFESQGYTTLIIDSLSHAWMGDGGILSVVDKGASTNKFGNWKEASPKHNSLIEAITKSKMHIIVTMRSKTEWVLELNERGKQVPRKVGIGYVQRDGTDYEFMCILQMEKKGTAIVEKDNTQTYADNEQIQPNEEMGQKFLTWLNNGSEPVDEEKVFSETFLPDIINKINSSEDSLELREVYARYYHGYSKKYPTTFKKIDEAKDAKKKELEAKIDLSFPPGMNKNFTRGELNETV